MDYSTMILFSGVLPSVGFAASVFTLLSLAACVIIGVATFCDDDANTGKLYESYIGISNRKDDLCERIEKLDSECKDMFDYRIRGELDTIKSKCTRILELQESIKKSIDEKGNVIKRNKIYLCISSTVFIISLITAIICPSSKSVERYIMMKFVEEHCMTGEMTDAIMNRFDELLTIIDNHYKK